ncbi:MAG TPA: flavin reductase family protein [Microbacterium sp.]|uniref:flavin reductase family protein n=1 Tax=Microbacterium sp. TaxID=51671 RepID=UPI002B49BE8F|nr:flavin reductase family protein [Microbacterium sp.]HKT56008.1 flavin reductase family protein [Microbacterium sp.]
MVSPLIFHIAITDDWDMSEMAGEYSAATRGVAYEPGGHIRATTAAGIQAVLDDRYADLHLPLTLVALDPDRLAAEGVPVEQDADGAARIRGEIPRDDSGVVVSATALERIDGRWIAPGPDAAPAGASAGAPSAGAEPETGDPHLVIEPETLYIGTPAFLIATTDPDGAVNLAPASSYWALGRMLVLGIETEGKTADNLLAGSDVTVSIPSPGLWPALVRLSTLTGRDPVPEAKAHRYRYEPDKFGAAQLTAQASELVAPPRVRECLLQFEARTRRLTPAVDGGYLMVEAEVVRVHAAQSVVREDRHGHLQVDPARWHPIVYAFRHFFDRGDEVGWLASSRTASHAPVID